MKALSKILLGAVALMSTTIGVFAADTSLKFTNDNDIKSYYNSLKTSQYLAPGQNLIKMKDYSTAGENSRLDWIDAVKEGGQEVIDCSLVFASDAESKQFTDLQSTDMPKAYELLNTLSKDGRQNYCTFTKTSFEYNALLNEFKAEAAKGNKYIIAGFALNSISDKLQPTNKNVATLGTVVGAQFKKVDIIEEVKQPTIKEKIDNIVKPIEVKKPEPTKPEPKPTPKPIPEPEKVKVVCETGKCSFDGTKDSLVSGYIKTVKGPTVCDTKTTYSMKDQKTGVTVYFTSNKISKGYKGMVVLKLKGNYSVEEVKVDNSKYKDWTFRILNLWTY